MSGVMFLLVAVALSLVGSSLVWLRHRQPTSVDHGIKEFHREMRALAPVVSSGRPRALLERDVPTLRSRPQVGRAKLRGGKRWHAT